VAAAKKQPKAKNHQQRRTQMTRQTTSATMWLLRKPFWVSALLPNISRESVTRMMVGKQISGVKVGVVEGGLFNNSFN
jgi:hypothetical protein